MPAVHSKSFLSNKWHIIDEEWAQRLIGLRMKIRGTWWSAEWGIQLYDGLITSYDHSIRRWKVTMDDDSESYDIRYDAVIQYADEEASTFEQFNLPELPVAPPATEATVGPKNLE